MAPRRKSRAPSYRDLFGDDGSGTSSSGPSSSGPSSSTAVPDSQPSHQQVRLDSLEDLLDVMAVGNPVMQRMLSQRRAALGLPVRDPQESDPTRQQPSNPTDYFDDM
ncbi:hypothetical protein YC2023_109900 [Brassica napus]